MPWNALVPDLVEKLSMPEVVRPNSAEGVEVVTLNSCSASMEGEVSSKEEMLQKSGPACHRVSPERKQLSGKGKSSVADRENGYMQLPKSDCLAGIK